ncbi:hypothetical protein BXZ70DRAFT_1007351 [Cristinia sonorae]|uniref:Histone deacetylase complex subunit SAP30 Sin3 binding domain-containing protein n=1 Tax=Cristinia sonorae TaxID=1940300 RepID=A0A8K0URC2_9AGAR|nr:hypothetical protein BXZ70DRAFT_1007351 [Cristinia sonorae]
MPFTANAPPPSISAGPPPSSRARQQGTRRKANPTADDAAYHGASATGVKRGAAEKADGEPRGKRKRAEAGSAGVSAMAGPSAGAGMRRTTADRPIEAEGKPCSIDFNTLPTTTLHRYLAQYDLIPDVDPSPTTAHDPPPPSHLLNPVASRHSSSRSPPPLPVTPANRPRRETSASGNRRRSARLHDEDLAPSVVPVLADVAEFHGMLAAIAERHFREHMVREVDTLTTFMFALKGKGFGHGD